MNHQKHKCRWKVIEDWGHAGGFDFDLEQCATCKGFCVHVYHSPTIYKEIPIDRAWVKRIRACKTTQERKQCLMDWFNRD